MRHEYHNPLAKSSPDHEDQELVLRARSGDRQGLEDLVQRHQAWIYNIAVRMLYHPQDAEDATQEILIKVLTRLSSFEGPNHDRSCDRRDGWVGLSSARKIRREPGSTMVSFQ